MMNEKELKNYEKLVDMLKYKDDLYNLIDDLELDPKSYTYLKRNGIQDVASILEFIVTGEGIKWKKIRRYILENIYGSDYKKVINYLDRMAAIDKIDYYEKQIKILKMKYELE